MKCEVGICGSPKPFREFLVNEERNGHKKQRLIVAPKFTDKCVQKAIIATSRGKRWKRSHE